MDRSPSVFWLSKDPLFYGQIRFCMDRSEVGEAFETSKGVPTPATNSNTLVMRRPPVRIWSPVPGLVEEAPEGASSNPFLALPWGGLGEGTASSLADPVSGKAPG